MHSLCRQGIRKFTSPIIWERNNFLRVPKRVKVLPLNSHHLQRTILTAGTTTPAGGMRRSGITTGRDGVDLSDLATEYSICSSKEEGGMLGWVRKGQLVSEFEEAAFSSPLNKLVRCKTKFGWHLLQVLAEREGGFLTDIEPEELYVKMQEYNFANEAQLMDVREPEEISIASLPGFKVYPLRQFGSWAPTITADLDPVMDTYVLCHHGMRSLQVARWLQTQGFKRVFNISGGIHAYSQKVDSSIPTY